MESYSLPPIAAVPSLPNRELASILDHLFEPSVPLQSLSNSILQNNSFSTYDELIASIGVQLRALAESSSSRDKEWLESILSAHPRLGEKNIHSSQSKAEQAQLVIGKESAQDELADLNALYERTFPGLRYVYVRSVYTLPQTRLFQNSVFVDGRDPSTIIEDIQLRVDRNDIRLERSLTIEV